MQQNRAGFACEVHRWQRRERLSILDNFAVFGASHVRPIPFLELFGRLFGIRTDPERSVTDSAARRRTNAAWLRAQLEGLRFAAAVREMPHREWKQAVAAIVEGKPWQVL